MIYSIDVTVGVLADDSEQAIVGLHEFMASLDGVGLIKWWTIDSVPAPVIASRTGVDDAG